MKKSVWIICAALLLAVVLAACGAKGTTAESGKPAEPEKTAEAETAAPEGMYITYNGTNVAVGMKFADVEAGLGEPVSPAQDVLPCDGNADNKTIMHFYGKFAITEDNSGVIIDLEISDLFEGEGDPALMGKVHFGDKQADAVAALGEPDNYPLPEDDYALTYEFEDSFVYVFLNPDNNKDTVNGVSISLKQPMPIPG